MTGLVSEISVKGSCVTICFIFIDKPITEIQTTEGSAVS